MSQELKAVFSNLISKYTDQCHLIDKYWEELIEMYAQSHRYYHNPRHLEAIIGELANVKNLINDYDAVLFAVFYHDVIYNVANNDNEAQSADWAKIRMKGLGIHQQMIVKVSNYIVATQSHDGNIDTDGAYFLDADLCVLGKKWDDYLTYAQSVRKEYSIYSDELYTVGRKKVLQQLLLKPTIYQTNYFQHKYEPQARENIKREIVLL